MLLEEAYDLYQEYELSDEEFISILIDEGFADEEIIEILIEKISREELIVRQWRNKLFATATQFARANGNQNITIANWNDITDDILQSMTVPQLQKLKEILEKILKNIPRGSDTTTKTLATNLKNRIIPLIQNVE